MTSEKITCFLPIEVKARELDTKIYLALISERGFSVVIGAKPQVHKYMLSFNKPLIYFSKGINPQKWNLYNVLNFQKV